MATPARATHPRRTPLPDHIRAAIDAEAARIVADAPPLTREQIAALSALYRRTRRQRRTPAA